MQNTNTHDPLLTRVRELIAPLCDRRELVLVDLRWLTERGARTLRVTIERLPAGGVDRSSADVAGRHPGEGGWGVTLDDCAELSREISAELDRSDPIEFHYQLEVSSPGLERPLYSLDDFRRFRGTLARVKLARPAPDGQRVLRGALLDVTGPAIGSESETTHIIMNVDGKRFDVAYEDVVEANLVFQPASGSSIKGPPKGKSTQRKTRADNKSTKEGARRGVTKRS